MKVLVCGGRDFDDWAMLNWKLTTMFVASEADNWLIIQGGAKGADFLAKVWAKWKNENVYYNRISCKEYPADWKKHGVKAGPIRNQQMLDEGKPDIVVAFPGGRGTKNMIKLAVEQGFTTVVLGDDDE